jgi:Yip1 domain
MDLGKLIERAKNICLSPKTEWPKIAEEQATTGSIFTGYIMILALIPALATVVASLVGGRMGLTFGIGAAVIGYGVGLAVVFIASVIVNALAPTFDGTKNSLNALKVIAYSMTPGWLAGIFNIIPFVGWVVALIGSIYGIYLLYLGLSPLMKNPQDKSVGYTALVIVCYIVIFMVLTFIFMGLLLGGAMMGGAALMR